MEQKQQSLPFLPGMSRSPQKASGKTQGLAVKNGVMIVAASDTESLLEGDTLHGAPSPDDDAGFVRKSAVAPPAPATSAGAAPGTPGWLKYSQERLEFEAWFKEGVESSAAETERVRRVVIRQYLSDNTVAIFEPRVVNSGIPQGQLLKRAKVAKTKGRADFYKPGDFVLGRTYTIYGRTYTLTGTNGFTRKFYASELGLDVGEPGETPLDAFAARAAATGQHNLVMNESRKFAEAALGRGYIDVKSSKQFFSRDGQVLCFYATWEDPAADGERRAYKVLYFLADDTVEVNEIKQANSGREQFPSLLKRSRLPRNHRDSTCSVASIGAGAAGDYVMEGEIRVGGLLNVYGRDLLVCDCDDFTKRYMKEAHGQEPVAPIKMFEDPKPLVRMEMPPPNGYGTEEDSAGSFTNLVPRPPRKDMTKILKYGSASLRFLAALASPAVEDVDRRFVITYFMCDETISIFEKVIRNSGFVGGKLLERSRVKDATGNFIQPQQFFVGANVTVNQQAFRLLEADAYTVKFMEQESAIFPQADLARVVDHLKSEGLDAAKAATVFDANGDGKVDRAEFARALEASGYFLTEHETLTVLRHCDANGDGTVSVQEFVAKLQ